MTNLKRALKCLVKIRHEITDLRITNHHVFCQLCWECQDGVGGGGMEEKGVVGQK